LSGSDPGAGTCRLPSWRKPAGVPAIAGGSGRGEASPLPSSYPLQPPRRGNASSVPRRPSRCLRALQQTGIRHHAITGIFLDEVSHDIPSANWGPAEWAADFDAMAAVGIDTVILIRAGYRAMRWANRDRTINKWVL